MSETTSTWRRSVYVAIGCRQSDGYAKRSWNFVPHRDAEQISKIFVVGEIGGGGRLAGAAWCRVVAESPQHDQHDHRRDGSRDRRGDLQGAVRARTDDLAGAGVDQHLVGPAGVQVAG